MSERFLDAAMWFGEAVRSDVLSVRVVNYINAIERIVTGGNTVDIAQTAATRVADLVFDPGKSEEWQTNRASLLKAYDLRSDLVHGSISPHNTDVSEGVAQCGHLAELLLVATLCRYGEDALEFAEITDARYAEWFPNARKYVQTCLDRHSATEATD